MARLSADAWIALGLLALGGFVLRELAGTEAAGAFVTTTSLPTALVVVLMALSALLLLGALRKSAVRKPASITGVGDTETRREARAGLARVFGMVAWLAVYIAALPWLGYLAASAAFLVGASLLYGQRRWGVILSWALLLPVALLMFFEKFMIVLLPASRLWG